MSKAGTHQGIVVGVDGSLGSKLAVQWAARDAELRNVPLTLVHVLPSTVAARLGTPLPWMGTSEQKRELGQQVIDEALAIVDECCQRRPVNLNCEMPSAHVVAGLVNQSKGATLLVVGRRGSATEGGRRWAR